jgi:hypothetical protein
VCARAKEDASCARKQRVAGRSHTQHAREHETLVVRGFGFGIVRVRVSSGRRPKRTLTVVRVSGIGVGASGSVVMVSLAVGSRRHGCKEEVTREGDDFSEKIFGVK